MRRYSLSGYRDPGGIGGAETIDAELEVANQAQESYFRLPVRLFAPWYEAKQKVNEKIGLRYGINYTAVYLSASEGLDDASQTNAASGVIDIPVSWSLVGRESGNTGTFSFKFENRHIFGSRPVSPMFLGFESGSLLLPATKANNFTFRFTEMLWQQALANNRVHLVLGKLDPTNYYTFHGLVHPFMNYFGYGSSVSPTANWPNQGAGIIGSVRPTEQLYINLGLHDAGGDPFTSGEASRVGIRTRTPTRKRAAVSPSRRTGSSKKSTSRSCWRAFPTARGRTRSPSRL
jgi:porin